MADKLFKVYVKTLDHAHISEMLVSAPNKVVASERALGHVKAANPEKGRSTVESRRNSTVVAIKVAGKNGCIVSQKIPLAVFKDISKFL